MQANSSTKITLYQIKDNAAKIQLILAKAAQAFQNGKRLLIAVPSFEAAQYIDTLLWRSPDDSFMPHVISDTRTKEWIAITMQEKENINQAPCLLNLLPHYSPLSHTVREIYDLFDETSPQKLESSKERLRLYREKGFSINYSPTARLDRS